MEQEGNLEQISLQHDNLVVHNQGLEQAVEEAYTSVLGLVVPAKLPTAEKIHHMAARFHMAKEETVKVQLDLNLQITELRLKMHPFTPLEVREQCHHTIQSGLEVIEHAV